MSLENYGDKLIEKVARFVKKKIYVFWTMQDEQHLETAGFEDYDHFLDVQLEEFDYLSDHAKKQSKTVIKVRVEEINQDPLHPIRLYDKIQQEN